MYVSSILCGLLLWYMAVVNAGLSSGPATPHTLYSLLAALTLVGVSGFAFISRRTSAALNLALVVLMLALAIGQSLQLNGTLELSTFAILLPLAPVVAFSALSLARSSVHSQRHLAALVGLVAVPAIIATFLAIPIARYVLSGA